MKNTYNKLTCLFGHHDYSEESTIDKDGRAICLCKICKRKARWKLEENFEALCDYNKEEHCIHIKFYDGFELWFDNNGNWIERKPKNWKYEKYIQ